MKAEIIAVGTELLMGEILNSNSRDIARELYNLGIDVYHQSVVGDNLNRVSKELETAICHWMQQEFDPVKSKKIGLSTCGLDENGK